MTMMVDLRRELRCLQDDLAARMQALATPAAGDGPAAISGICCTCGLPVVGDEAGCVVFDKVHHRACLSCDVCKISLAQSGCYLSDGQILCRLHYLKREGKLCSACKDPIEGTMIQAFGENFHSACFTCIDCKRPCGAIEFFDYDGRPCCGACHAAREHASLPRCDACQGAITSQFVKVNEGSLCLHPECFCCADCKVELSGRPYVSGGTDRREFRCQECHHRATGPKCTACRQVIMPSGSDNAVHYLCLDDCKFHTECFKCHQCHVKLAFGHYGGDGSGEPAFLREGQLFCPAHDPSDRASPVLRQRLGRNGSSRRSGGKKRVSFLLDTKAEVAEHTSGTTAAIPPPLPPKASDASCLRNGVATTGCHGFGSTATAATVTSPPDPLENSRATGSEYVEAPERLVLRNGMPEGGSPLVQGDTEVSTASENLYGFPGFPATRIDNVAEPIYDDIVCDPVASDAPPALPQRRYTMVPRPVSPNPLGSPRVTRRRSPDDPTVPNAEPSFQEKAYPTDASRGEDSTPIITSCSSRTDNMPAPPPLPPACVPSTPSTQTTTPVLASVLASVRQGVKLRSAAGPLSTNGKVINTESTKRFSFSKIFANGMPQLRRRSTVGRQS